MPRYVNSIKLFPRKPNRGRALAPKGYRAWRTSSIGFPSSKQAAGTFARAYAGSRRARGFTGNMPLQSHLLAEGHRTPVIFITAVPEAKFRSRAKNAGAVGFLSKPFDEESLINCLDTALNALATDRKLAH